MDAAQGGDLKYMQSLINGLSVAVSKTKFGKAAEHAIWTLVNFMDPRTGCTAAYAAAQDERVVKEWRHWVRHVFVPNNEKMMAVLSSDCPYGFLSSKLSMSVI